ncbi:MAG TPA: long-chain fatty acid--CoA ligase, partial [Chloroflexi bacterium]|nr:long-chain fatty acid--CoA ligase [Chloroflexota bacterium]
MTGYSDKPWLNNYEDTVAGTVEFPDKPLQNFLVDSASKYPEKTAIIFKGHKINYRELSELSDAVAAALISNGFKKGDRAVIYMVNTPQFVISYFGILKAGGIVIATNPLYTERELEHQLVDCGAETVFVMSLYYELLKRVQSKGMTSVKRIILTNIKEYLPPHLKLLFTIAKEKKDGHRVTLQPGDMWFQDFVAAGKQAPKVNVDVRSDDAAILQYTGGTTGLSKGAIGLHRNLVANTIMIRTWLTDTKEGEEVMLTALPLFHSFGMIVAMNFGLLIGGTLVLIPDPRDQKDLLSSINKYKPTIFPGVPALYVAINNNPDVAAGKYAIDSIKICVSGSAPLLLETKQHFEEITGGKLVEGFGLTEAHVVTHCNPIYAENRPGSIGLPLPNVECRIVDPEEGTKDLPFEVIGELIIKGPSIMQGYWQMPTETANTLRDGWLYTGDIARMDEDGYFYIEDRKKDMIIAGG